MILSKILKKGGVAVIPTDTIYGIVGSVKFEDTVERIYSLRKRSSHKPMIILISSLDDLKLFKIKLSPKIKLFLEKVWPGPLSVILPSPHDQFAYLHRGSETLAFRLPEDEFLLELLKETGPLTAPSANTEGQPPSTTIGEAQEYFGAQIDYYEDAGKRNGESSTLIKFDGDKVVILRQGAFKIEQ